MKENINKVYCWVLLQYHMTMYQLLSRVWVSLVYPDEGHKMQTQTLLKYNKGNLNSIHICTPAADAFTVIHCSLYLASVTLYTRHRFCKIIKYSLQK
jgi:hypothetical protein